MKKVKKESEAPAGVTPLQKLEMFAATRRSVIRKARGVSVSMFKVNDAMFEDILTTEDGEYIAVIRYKDSGETDTLLLRDLSETELLSILDRILS